MYVMYVNILQCHLVNAHKQKLHFFHILFKKYKSMVFDSECWYAGFLQKSAF